MDNNEKIRASLSRPLAALARVFRERGLPTPDALYWNERVDLDAFELALCDDLDEPDLRMPTVICGFRYRSDADRDARLAHSRIMGMASQMRRVGLASYTPKMISEAIWAAYQRDMSKLSALIYDIEIEIAATQDEVSDHLNSHGKEPK